MSLTFRLLTLYLLAMTNYWLHIFVRKSTFPHLSTLRPLGCLCLVTCSFLFCQIAFQLVSSPFDTDLFPTPVISPLDVGISPTSSETRDPSGKLAWHRSVGMTWQRAVSKHDGAMPLPRGPQWKVERQCNFISKPWQGMKGGWGGGGGGEC